MPNIAADTPRVLIII